jgi:hypothetical protein
MYRVFSSQGYDNLYYEVTIIEIHSYHSSSPSPYNPFVSAIAGLPVGAERTHRPQHAFEPLRAPMTSWYAKVPERSTDGGNPYRSGDSDGLMVTIVQF